MVSDFYLILAESASVIVQWPLIRPASYLISCLPSRTVSSDLLVECFRNTFAGACMVHSIFLAHREDSGKLMINEAGVNVTT